MGLVKFVGKNHEDDNDEHVTLGHYIPMDNEISIFVTKPEVQRAVLVHEIVEAVDHLCDLGLNHTQITTLGTAINQLLIENPAFKKLYDKNVK